MLALALSTISASGEELAQPAAQPGAGPTIIVPINGTQRLQMSTKKKISKASNSNETVARIQATVDPTTILIVGQEPGIARITLVDEDGKVENFEVIVQMDVEYLRTLLKRGIRTANIEVIPAANNTVILEGIVPHAEDIDAVLRLTATVVGSPDRIINRLRQPGPVQVQLDVVVARVARSEFRRMAFSFFNTGPQTFFGSSIGIANSVTANSTIALQNGSGLFNGTPGNLFLGIANSQESFFGFLQALREENIVKLMAEPRLVTLSGRPASFLSGGEQAIPVPAGLGQIGVQFEEFGTRLNFLPIVMGNGRIHLEVEPEVSFLDPAAGVNIQGTTVPGRSTQRVHTTVEMETGQTFIIGGLIQRLVRGSTVKVPILGDAPFIGAFFSRKNFEETEEELIVMVTPYLVDPMACNQVPKHLPGQETRTPDDFELFLEGILEAPRGKRYPFAGHRYSASHMTGPTASQFPCYGTDGCHTNGCSSYGCTPNAGGAATGHPAPMMRGPVGREEVRPLGTTHPQGSLPELSPAPRDRLPGSQGQ